MTRRPPHMARMDWRDELRRLPEPLRDCKRLGAVAWELQCLEHRAASHALEGEALAARRGRLLALWDGATSQQLRMFGEEDLDAY